MGEQIYISVSAEGWFNEIIELNDDCKLTKEEICKKLYNGDLVTTIQEGGSLDITATGESIGKVINVDNELTYADFD